MSTYALLLLASVAVSSAIGPFPFALPGHRRYGEMAIHTHDGGRRKFGLSLSVPHWDHETSSYMNEEPQESDPRQGFRDTAGFQDAIPSQPKTRIAVDGRNNDEQDDGFDQDEGYFQYQEQVVHKHPPFDPEFSPRNPEITVGSPLVDDKGEAKGEDRESHPTGSITMFFKDQPREPHATIEIVNY